MGFPQAREGETSKNTPKCGLKVLLWLASPGFRRCQAELKHPEERDGGLDGLLRAMGSAKLTLI